MRLWPPLLGAAAAAGAAGAAALTASALLWVLACAGRTWGGGECGGLHARGEVAPRGRLAKGTGWIGTRVARFWPRARGWIGIHWATAGFACIALRAWQVGRFSRHTVFKLICITQLRYAHAVTRYVLHGHQQPCFVFRPARVHSVCCTTQAAHPDQGVVVGFTSP